MKVIELLNKIANGEEAPQKVLYDENEYSYVGRNRFFAKYIREPFDARVPYYLFTDVWSVYEEVEPIEESKGIPEKLSYYSMEKIQKAKNKDEWQEERISLLEKRVEDLHIKMNELLDYLESKGE